jgi:hypothetical protein
VHDWLLFLHIVAAMVWVGGGVLLGVLVTRVLHDEEPDAVARFVRGLRAIGPLVLAPATVAVVGFGVWLVLDSDAWASGSSGSSSRSRSSPRRSWSAPSTRAGLRSRRSGRSTTATTRRRCSSSLAGRGATG